MNAVVNLVQLQHHKKTAIIDELANALRNIKEDDFVKTVKTLEKISVSDLIKAWEIIHDLKDVVPSAREEIISGAHRDLWIQQKGY